MDTDINLLCPYDLTRIANALHYGLCHVHRFRKPRRKGVKKCRESRLESGISEPDNHPGENILSRPTHYERECSRLQDTNALTPYLNRRNRLIKIQAHEV